MPSDHDVQREIEQLEQRFAENAKGLVFAHLADAYRRAGEFAKAEGLILHGLRNHPSYISAYNVLGRIYLDSERYADAHEQFNRVLQLDPHNLIALRALGDLAVQSDRPDEARSWYEQMLQIDPRNEEVRGELQRLADREGPEDGAEVAFVAEYVAPSPLDLLEAESAGAEAGSTGGAEQLSPDEQAAAADAESLAETMPWEQIRDVSSLDPDTGDTQEPELRPSLADADEPLESGPELAAESEESSPIELAPEEAPGLDIGDLEAWTPGFFDETDSESSDFGLGAEEFGEDSFIEALEQGFELTLADDEAGEGADVDTGGALVTETMAELYAKQGLYADALRVYQQLAEVRPTDDRLQKRIVELQEQVAEVEGAPPADDLADLLEITGTPTPEPAELAAEPEPSDAEEPFDFQDEAPVAGLEQLDPFAVSFNVLAQSDVAPPPSSLEEVSQLAAAAEVADLAVAAEVEEVGVDQVVEVEEVEAVTTAEPLWPDEVPVTHAEASEVAAEAQVESVATPELSVADERSIEDYLLGLLAFDAEAARRRPRHEEPEESGNSDAGGAAPGSEDLEQFQEWLRGLKR